MAVAHSAASESHTGTTGSTSQTSFSWTHTQTGTPQGVLVFVHVLNSTANPVGTVTYGTVTLTRVSGGAAVDTDANEQGRTDLFFAGSGLPSGNQTITVNRSNTVDTMYASAATVTAATNTNVTGIVLLQNDGTLAEQSVNDGSPGTNSVRYAAVYTGLNAPPAAGASSTLLTSIDIGNFGAAMVRETTAGQGARSVGFSSGTSDDRAAVHVAVRELFNRTETPIVGAFTLTGRNADLRHNVSTVGERGSFTLTGQPADTRHNVKIDGGTGAFTFTGQPADLASSRIFRPLVGSFALSSNGATFAVATVKAIDAAVGSFALSGKDAQLKQSRALAAGTGAFALVGNDATLADTDRLAAEAGAFAATGNDAALARGLQLGATAGAFALTGPPPALTATGSYELLAVAGELDLTGNPASLLKGGLLNAERGQLALTGLAAALTRASRVEAVSGTFAFTGRPATFKRGYLLSIATGGFALTGNSVNLTDVDVLFAGTGSFAATGLPVELTKAGTTRRRNVLIF